MTKEEGIKLKEEILKKEGSLIVGNLVIDEVILLNDVLDIINHHVNGVDWRE